MTLEEINKKLIFDAIEDENLVIPSPEELKKKFGKKPLKPGWYEVQMTADQMNAVSVKWKTKTIEVDWSKEEQVAEEEKLLEALFEIMKSKMKGG